MNIIKTIKGIILMLNYTKMFNPNKIFKGKRIAIIGAADSAFKEENGEYINGFDFIIRVNKAPHSLTPEKFKYIGNRTDILLHSFYENSNSGGGPIDLELYNRQGIKYIINPNNNFKGLRVHLNYFKRNLNKVATYILQKNIYGKMTREFSQWTPTIGYSALFIALNAPYREIFITGFTFFKTPYANDYRDHFKDMERNKEHIRNQAIHNPDIELKQFIKELNIAFKKNPNIKMDRTLSNIVDLEIKKAHNTDEN